MDFINQVADTICGIAKLQKPLALVLSLCATHTFMGVDVLEQFIKAETPIAKTSLLANIGPKFEGAKPGVVVASPSKGEGSDPDYVYTWTRDSALVFKVLVDQYMRGEDDSLNPIIKDFITAEAEQQKVANPSGDFKSGEGLGEPKFHINLTAYEDVWSRPQRDGPALRSITAITYATHLLSGGDDSEKKFVNDVIWPMVESDLAYVAEFWNHPTYDLWEEVNSTGSYYTSAMQLRSLHEGLRLGTKLKRIDGRSAKRLAQEAKKLACYTQAYWNPVGSFMNANAVEYRSGIDANTVLASIHGFDVEAGCSSETFQPCSDQALANLKAYVDSFREEYVVNSGIRAPKAVATGRYREDVYFGGNPWYLTTAACAEQLYDALIVWKKQGYIDVSYVSLPFFQQFDYFLKVGRYKAKSETFQRLIDAVGDHADEFLVVVAAHTPSDGSLAEQYDRRNGTPLSAKRLTWSYAAVLSAFAAREGKHQASWGAKKIAFKDCGGGSGPRTGMVEVTFRVKVETMFRENVYLTGSSEVLRHWSALNALSMSAEQYPIWTLTVALPANERVHYKYIRKSDDIWRDVTWMPGPDKELTPQGEKMVVDDNWEDSWFPFDFGW